MKATELRIGNWVHDKLEGQDRRILWQDLEIMCESSEEGYEPVPLTGEWLLKFGFIQTYFGWEKENESF